VLVISGFSTDAFSAEKTGGHLLPWLKWLFPRMSDAGLDALHIAVRKAGHVAEFAMLAMLWYRALAWGRSGWRGREAAASALLSLGIAAVDEWRQGFTQRRGGNLADVGWDALGALAALAGLWLLFRVGDRIRVRIGGWDRAHRGVPRNGVVVTAQLPNRPEDGLRERP
jgi:VanZ family protein